MSTAPRRVVILGAAGRDFHDFNTVFRDNPAYRVVAFTATQIPGIDARRYPAVLAGELYPQGIPIVPEQDLPELIRTEKPDVAVFAYSDVTHEHVGHMASLCVAMGVDFELLGADKTMIKAKVPVIGITAVRTGAGKSQTTRYISNILKGLGKKVVAIRHPMPYGDLARQACQRFATYSDLDLHDCTIEEREEYEPHIDNGFVCYAGVDYEQIIRQAEKEADVILWDGGNNDLPFYACDLHICVADPLRAGHELIYHPGEANFRRADIIIINKCDSAKEADIQSIEANAARLNPKALVHPGRFSGDLRASGHGARPQGPRHRGRPHPHPRFHDLRRRRGGRPPVRRRRHRRPRALRREVDRLHLREIPQRPGHPARHGLRAGADRRPAGHHRGHPLRSGRLRHPHRPHASAESH